MYFFFSFSSTPGFIPFHVQPQKAAVCSWQGVSLEQGSTCNWRGDPKGPHDPHLPTPAHGICASCTGVGEQVSAALPMDLLIGMCCKATEPPQDSPCLQWGWDFMFRGLRAWREPLMLEEAFRHCWICVNNN